jgi:chemotaxis signal transduction protein
MDPIGAQLIVDHLNETAEIMSAQLEEANQIIASDARKLLEAVARQTS